MSDRYNKDEPSLLQQIQNKTGCLFLVIGVAMLAFVLTDLVGSGSSIFGSQANNVGTIGGEAISYEEFNGQYEQLKAQTAQNNPGFQIDEAMSKQFRDQAWNMLIEKNAIEPQYEALGLAISNSELEDLTVGENTHPQLKQSFTDPNTKQFDKQALNRFLREDIYADPAKMKSWNQFQKQFTSGLVAQKYNSLVSRSFYTTDLEARQKSKDDRQTINANVVAIPYATVKDDEITVTDSDISSYVKRFGKKYEQEASRDIEFVKINVLPSAADSASMVKWAAESKAEFASRKDDSSYLSLMNSESLYDPRYKQRSSFAPEVAEVLWSTPVGTVVGPFQRRGVYSLYKVTGTGSDTSGKTLQVAALQQSIYPSTKTDGAYYKQAGELLANLGGEKSFEEVADELRLSKRVANKVTEKDRFIPGIENTTELVRWMFNSETSEGDVSEIINLNGSYVVARLTNIREKGIPSVEDLRSEIEPLVKNEKKAEILVPKFEEALKSATSADALATALATNVVDLPAAALGSASVPGLGQDDKVSGAIFGTPVGKNSGIIEGRYGVAVVYVNNENQYSAPDLKSIKMEMNSNLAQRAAGSIRNALTNSAEVVDTRYKFYE